ncbi:MAG: phage terminase large subunit [Rikenellaceae bacterium]
MSVPPQHGKSLGASNLLPAYLLGINPELRIAIASYSFMLARRFGAGVQKTIESSEYQEIFPATKLKGMKGAPKSSTAQRTTDEFDIVKSTGGLRVVGREGSLTGNRVDVMILDDMYKDASEANSPIIRENVWAWYCSVVKTRLHNDSQELIVFTRWNEDDLIGRLIELEGKEWKQINFEALKSSPASKLDPRRRGEALWPERHSAKLLKEKRKIDPIAFEALYQGNPKPPEGLLYGTMHTYCKIEDQIVKRAAYIDTADKGKDYLCAVCYALSQSGVIYIEDVVYSKEAMETTEGLCADMLKSRDTQFCYVESNNGGRGFARTLQRLVPRCRIESFFQSGNKVSRILSNSTEVTRLIRMPEDWKRRWKQFARDIEATKREVEASVTDDAADTLTGIIEKEQHTSAKKISKVAYSSRH